jgi:hypothetical protein
VTREGVLALDPKALARLRLELQKEWLRGQPRPGWPDELRRVWGYLMAGIS